MIWQILGFRQSLGTRHSVKWGLTVFHCTANHLQHPPCPPCSDLVNSGFTNVLCCCYYD